MCSNDSKINTIAHYMFWMHFQTPSSLTHTHTLMRPVLIRIAACVCQVWPALANQMAKTEMTIYMSESIVYLSPHYKH